MGSLLHIPTPFQVLTLTREIETATVSTWDNDPALKASGSLGVVTREIAYPQPGDSPHRDYGGKADVPALACLCYYQGMFKYAVATWALRYDLEIYAVAETASARAAFKQCMDIMTVAQVSISQNVYTQENTWIASALPIFVGEEVNDGTLPGPERPVARENKTDRYESTATVPLTVLWTREVMQ